MKVMYGQLKIYKIWINLTTCHVVLKPFMKSYYEVVNGKWFEIHYRVHTNGFIV